MRIWWVLAVLACSGNNHGGDDDVPDAATLAKCGDGHVDPGEQCDDGNTIANDGCTLCMIDTQRMAAIAATWELSTVAGATSPCPSGFDTASIIAQPVGGDGMPAGSAHTTELDCATGSGTSDKLAATTYTAQIVISNHDMSSVYATSDPQPIDLSDGTDKMVDAKFVTDGGKFKLAWKLVKMSDSSQVTCDQVSTMPRVKVLVTPDGSASGTSTTFSCAGGMASTQELVAGSFGVTVSILNDAFMSAGAAAPLTGQVITAPNGVTDLGVVTIPITAL